MRLAVVTYQSPTYLMGWWPRDQKKRCAAGNAIQIQSGGDTTLKGAVAQAQQIVANVGGNLTIESLQDTATYNETSKSSSVGVSLCIPPLCYGASSVSVGGGKTKIASDYQSVGEQSALKAGDGGFQVNVAGHTELVGGAITSTQAAIDQGRNHFETASLSTRNLHNTANFDANGYQVNVSVSGKMGDQSTAKTDAQEAAAAAPAKPGGSAGVGSDSGNASSTTQAAISGIAGNKDARTGDAETGIAKIFDKERTKQEIGAQIAITQEFGKQAPKAWADYAETQRQAALDRGDKEEAAQWAEGGAYRTAGHMVLGALGGGTAGAAGAGLSAGLMPEIGKHIDASDAPEAVKQALGMVAAATLGAITGPAGAASAFNVDVNNRQLHPSERKLAQDLAKRSGGKYTAEQIEEQMRLMGNKALKAEPNTITVLTGDQIPQSRDGKHGPLPLNIQGNVAVEIAGTYNAEIQQFIMGNTTHGEGGWIPGGSAYVASTPPVMVTAPKTLEAGTVGCANGDLACKSGVGAQQNDSMSPETAQILREGAGNIAAVVGRGAGVVSNAATAAAAVPGPHQAVAGAVAVTATSVDFISKLVEQGVSPSAGKSLFEIFSTAASDMAVSKAPVVAPVTNEIFEIWKNSGSTKKFTDWVDAQWNTFIGESK